MLKKICPRRGCRELINIDQHYCSKHTDTNAITQQHYDKQIRQGIDKQYHDFYHSEQWERVRMRAVVRDHGLCVECLKEDKITPYHVVHHIHPIKTPQGWDRRYDIDNLVCVCEHHHKILEREAKNQAPGGV